MSIVNIDYEVEVKKVYPDAYPQSITAFTYYIIVDGTNDDELIGEVSNDIPSSWQSAYENLKQQEKI